MVREYTKWRKRGDVIFTGQNLSNGLPTSSHGVLHHKYTCLEHLFAEGHPWFYLGKSRLDLGGPFDLYRQIVEGKLKPEWLRSPRGAPPPLWSNEYFTIPVPGTAVSSAVNGISNQNSAANAKSYIGPKIPESPSEITMDAMGSKAINMLNPTNPVADLATSVAEFASERKFFALPGTAGSLPGEYLNYMFGVAPTVGLTQDLRNAIANREKLTKQFIRDSGRWVRRRADVSFTTDVTKSVSTGYPSTIGPALSTSVAKIGQLTTITSTSQKFWFSGAFTYHLPKEGAARDMALLDYLYGVDPGATSTAWELLPFSWLADYKSSMGVSLQNIESFAEHGIVMPYAYIMCHTKKVVTYHWHGDLRGPTGLWEKRDLVYTVTTETKKRRAANPFGFGITANDLSPKQWSILAALGLSMGVRK